MKRLIVLFSLLISSFASAGILIEPQLGYIISSKFSGTTTVNSGNFSANDSYSGMTYGGRLGYQMLGVMGGINYHHMSGTGTDKTVTPNVEYDTSRDDLGVFIGYNAPILVRAWFAYNFSAKLNVDQTTTQTNKGDYLKGTSTEFGIGYAGLPFLSINFIYRMYDFTKYHDSTVPATYSASNNKPKDIELAISAPFNLF